MNYLTNKQIIEAFPDEVAKLVPRLLSARRAEMRVLAEHAQNIHLRYDDDTSKILILLTLWLDGCRIEKDIKRLKGLTFTKRQAKPSSKQDKEPVKDIDIEGAKAFPIEQIFDIERPKRSSKRIICRCPLHQEKTGSFVIYLDSNTWHCFSCGEGSSSIDLVMKLQGLNFKEAVEYLTT